MTRQNEAASLRASALLATRSPRRAAMRRQKAPGSMYLVSATQAGGHHAEQLPGAVARALDATLALAAVVVARRQSGPGGEVLLRGPLAQVSAGLAD